FAEANRVSRPNRQRGRRPALRNGPSPVSWTKPAEVDGRRGGRPCPRSELIRALAILRRALVLDDGRLDCTERQNEPASKDCLSVSFSRAQPNRVPPAARRKFRSNRRTRRTNKSSRNTTRA